MAYCGGVEPQTTVPARLFPRLLAAGLVLAVDAVTALLLACYIFIPTYYSVVGGSDARDVAAFGVPFFVAAVLALGCSAAATLVLVLRDRRSRVVGTASAAAMAISAGVAVPWGMTVGAPRMLVIAAVVVLASNVAALYELAGTRRAIATRGDSGAATVIDLDAVNGGR